MLRSLNYKDRHCYLVIHFGKLINHRFYFYFDKLPNDLAVIIVVIIACDAFLFSLSLVRTNIKKKKLDSSWTTETLCFDV